MSQAGALDHFLAGAMASGTAHLNAWVSLAEPAVAETIARTSFDSITLDFQHGSITVGGMIAGIGAAALAGKPAVVRIPVGDLGLASRALDAGAAGVICPMVNSAEDARAFADAVNFPPVGRRSWGPHRALTLSGVERTTYLHTANARSFAFAMVETEEAMARLDAIITTPGIDGVFVGPNDLSVSLTRGRSVDPAHPAVVTAIEKILIASLRHNRVAGIFANTPALAQEYVARGFRFVSLGNDVAFLRDRAEAVVAQVRGQPATADRPPM